MKRGGYRRRSIPVMTADAYGATAREDGMLDTVRELVAWKGGRLFHIRDSRGAPETEGMPDWLILIPGRILLIEAKSQSRDLTPSQADVAALMATVTEQTCGVVRPIPRPGEMSLDDLLAVIANTTC